MTLYRTAGGRRLHIEPCPDIHGAVVTPATDDDIANMEICHWSQAELSGAGRQHVDTLEDALREFAPPSDNWQAIRDHLAGIAHDEIWITNSRSYAALGYEGKTVAWFSKSVLRDVAKGLRVEMPNYEAGTGGGYPFVRRAAELCPRRYIEMSLTGRCEYCD